MTEDSRRDDAPDRDESRTFIGRQAWDADAIRAAHARLHKRRAAAERAAANRSALVPGQRPPRLPDPDAAPDPLDPEDRDPAVGRVLYAAGVSSAVAALIAVLVCLPLEAFDGPVGLNAGTAVHADPATVVEDFYDAIGAEDWRSAWALGGSNLGLGYDAFVAQYAASSVEYDDVEDTGVTTAKARLTVTAANGTEARYSGVYTVVDGVITGARVSPAD